MLSLKIKSLGPIADANIEFGDLTLLVGPQASGKSIFLQLLKLVVDKKHIRRTLEQYGFVWGNDPNAILDRYFGEGMAGIWSDNTEISFDHASFKKQDLLPKRRQSIKDVEETLFYIPAQRVVCLQNGWPRFFTDYEDSVPYVLRHFSETLRQHLETGMGKKDNDIFPKNQQLKAPLRDSFNESIFHDGKIVLDKTSKKRFKLNVGNSSIPFMTWSAGQKEFMPLLISFYWLCPASKSSRKDEIKYVVIEEPEMGLHPQAIESVILQIIDLISRDYKVIVSTHSPVLLEFAWAFQLLKESDANDKSLYDLFNLKKSAPLIRLFEGLLKSKNIKTYSFDRNSNKEVHVKNISSLDAGSDDKSIAEWGGLSSFIAKATDLISKISLNEK